MKSGAYKPPQASAFFVAGARGEIRHARGVAGCAPALVACAIRARFESPVPIVLVTKDAESAARLVDDLETFAPAGQTVLLPTSDRTPYDGVRPDRSVALGRAGALFSLDEGTADFFVTTAAGWIKRCPSKEQLQQGSLRLRLGEPLNLTEAAARLVRGGYFRAPIVEDPGTFAIRGDLLDLWPPGRSSPLRLEVDYDKLVSVRTYDAETQITKSDERGARESGALAIPPARETILSEEAKVRAERVLRTLADEASFPSKKARHLIDEVTSGRLFLGSDAYLPAMAELEPLTKRIGPDWPILFVDPSEIVRITQETLEQARDGFHAPTEVPHFPVAAHYVCEEDLDKSLTDRTVICLHDLAVSGGEAKGFAGLERAPVDCPALGTRDQSELQIAVEHARHAEGHRAGLGPLAARITSWQDEGLAVVVAARTETQTERIASLLLHRGLRVTREPPDFFRPQPGRLSVVTAPLAQGLLAEDAGLCLLTEEEIFGRRSHRTPKKASSQLAAALDDLRSLAVGDYVVHVEHGIGRYAGLVHHHVGQTTIELLVVEYLGGDRLLLPVYRLNQIQKLSGDAPARLDRLGGQTFAKTKSKVRKKVRIMADQLLKLYAERKAVRRAPLHPPGDDYATFEATFPYEETPDQAAAIADVLGDLEKDTVMDRLVCGDVGFGKTEVALRAAFVCAHAGRQVALLCPTTVLAEQHLRTFVARFGDSGIAVRGLSRFQSKKDHIETLAALKSGKVDVVIGTHRLLSKDVHFKNLGLLVIDEEQRFGVAHKERLKELKKTVDVLTLSATPIPRTLNLAVSGLRDISVIATAPLERRAIRTVTSRFDERLIEQAVSHELGRGGQVYYVHNRVEGIYERADLLRRLLPEARVLVAHGQMTERTLEKAMHDFVAGQCDILCATSIVESGLDIPSANTIIIDRADMFGLSQLYQIRGRVGRSAERAYCYLLVPDGARLSDEARARIAALEQYTELGSGFHVATMDMELRGAGELLGADQSGFVARVGFDLFSQMLEEATADLRGESYVTDVDPELSIDVEAFLPEVFIEDIGVRLSLYKRYALAEDEEQVDRITVEIEDRFGRLPPPAKRFSEVMRLKTTLRKLRALGLSATGKTATLHLRDDTSLAASSLVPFVAESRGVYSLSPDGRLTRRAPVGQAQENGLLHAELMLDELARLAARSGIAH